VPERQKPTTADHATASPTVVLTFHRVVEEPQRDHDFGWHNFLGLLDRLDPKRISAEFDRPITNRGADLVLTFDDATSDHLQAAEELHRRGIPAIFFVPTGKLGQPSFLSAEQVRDIHGLGHTVGAHGVTHTPLMGLPQDRVVREVADSKAMLEDTVQSSVVLFAPPGGVGNPSMVRALVESGYVASRSMRWGVYRSASDRWRIPTVPVTEVTYGRDWVAKAIVQLTMPLSMRAAWAAKQLLPAGIRTQIRRRIHAVGRRRAGGASE
jgi:peptidoglycan/xylan/chitin deacetylase (PgdA/CDA1 family)